MRLHTERLTASNQYLEQFGLLIVRHIFITYFSGFLLSVVSINDAIITGFLVEGLFVVCCLDDETGCCHRSPQRSGSGKVIHGEKSTNDGRETALILSQRHQTEVFASFDGFSSASRLCVTLT